MNERERGRLERQELWRSDPEGYEAILAILFRHDPIRICGVENPVREVEYACETNTILPRLQAASSLHEVQQIVHEEFVRWCSPGAGPKERYREIAREIWQWMQVRAESA